MFSPYHIVYQTSLCHSRLFYSSPLPALQHIPFLLAYFTFSHLCTFLYTRYCIATRAHHGWCPNSRSSRRTTRAQNDLTRNAARLHYSTPLTSHRFPLRGLDVAGQTIYMMCVIWLVVAGGSRIAYKRKAGLDLYYYRSCTTSPNGRLGSK